MVGFAIGHWTCHTQLRHRLVLREGERMGHRCCGGDDGIQLGAESNRRGIWGSERGVTNKHRKQVGVISTTSYIFG
jgi:hypothetical protein